MIKLSILFAVCWLFLGCTNVKPVPGYTNIKQCNYEERCSLDGVITLVEIDHVLMGKLETKEMSCINVSLPSSFIKKLSHQQKGISVVVTGSLYKTPILSEEDFNLEYRINGRRVGWNQCTDAYLFVENVRDIYTAKGAKVN